MNKDKSENSKKNQTLVIDAKKLGVMQSRSYKILTDEDIKKITNCVSLWKKNDGYKDIDGFCKSISTQEIEQNDFNLNPGRYVDYTDYKTKII